MIKPINQKIICYRTAGGSQDFDPIEMDCYVENYDSTRFKCKMCARFTSKSQIMRHLVRFHKICSQTANAIRSEARVSKKARLTCSLCGKAVGSLTKHLKEVHQETKGDATKILTTLKKSKQLKRESELSEKFIQDLNRFSIYHSKNRGYKRDSKYSQCRIENIKRIALRFASSGEDLADFLDVPKDPELEEALEITLLDFIDQMKYEGKAADTAIVYLNDLKRIISFK